jgi:hypothetical protein
VEFIESRDIEPEAWEAARKYAEALRRHPELNDWGMTVQPTRIAARPGYRTVYGVFAGKLVEQLADSERRKLPGPPEKAPSFRAGSSHALAAVP